MQITTLKLGSCGCIRADQRLHGTSQALGTAMSDREDRWFVKTVIFHTARMRALPNGCAAQPEVRNGIKQKRFIVYAWRQQPNGHLNCLNVDCSLTDRLATRQRGLTRDKFQDSSCTQRSFLNVATTRSRTQSTSSIRLLWGSTARVTWLSVNLACEDASLEEMRSSKNHDALVASRWNLQIVSLELYCQINLSKCSNKLFNAH